MDKYTNKNAFIYERCSVFTKELKTFSNMNFKLDLKTKAEIFC